MPEEQLHLKPKCRNIANAIMNRFFVNKPVYPQVSLEEI